ncbi:hypothetical protein IG631_22788 [Alternaria alternata]|nr:hypothetical protein IG631_22788 [Alternaria alternata]
MAADVEGLMVSQRSAARRDFVRQEQRADLDVEPALMPCQGYSMSMV